MELTILERLLLLQILPREGNYATLKILRKLREALSFSEEEHKTIGFKETEGRLQWEDATSTKDIPIGEKAMDTIREVLRNLDRGGKLSQEQMPLYERFIVNAKDE